LPAFRGEQVLTEEVVKPIRVDWGLYTREAVRWLGLESIAKVLGLKLFLACVGLKEINDA